MLPISMVGGVLFHNYMESISWVSPFLIFCMLTVTFTKLKVRELKITKFHWTLLCVQLLGCWAVYYMLYPINPVVAEGAFMCVFMSTATAAPVVTGLSLAGGYLGSNLGEWIAPEKYKEAVQSQNDVQLWL